ncbi:MAG: hypothetical protein HC834_01600 [Rhodospirillales bacterium]|nr:hypothetical protein [Rhodospirillales bacterium]
MLESLPETDLVHLVLDAIDEMDLSVLGWHKSRPGQLRGSPHSTMRVHGR